MILFTYFDVGGVVMMDFSGTDNWRAVKDDLSIPPEKWVTFGAFYDEVEHQMCKGRDADDFLPVFREKFGAIIPSGYSLLQNGLVDRFEVNKPSWSVVEEISKNCRVGLLTNMYPGMLAAIKKRGLIPDISWEIVIDSSEVRMEKPDENIYHLAQEKAGVANEEIFFADNTKANIETAQKLGWHTFFYDSVNPEESNRKLLQEFQRIAL